MEQILAEIQHLQKQIAASSIIIRLGLLVFAIGAVLDLLFHAAPASVSGALAIYLGQEGHNAHLVTLLGMVLILLGILLNKPRQAEPVRGELGSDEFRPDERRSPQQSPSDRKS